MFEHSISSQARRQIERVEQFMAGRDDALAIPRVSAEFLHTLVLSGGFRRGLELGTSFGYSGLWIGSALRHNGGTLVTMDRNADKLTRTRQTFADAGLATTITIQEGTIADLLPGVAGPFDFVFIDADKENCPLYLDLVWPKLAHHATLVTDNITSHREKLADFAALLRAHPGLTSTLVPIGSGLEVSVKVAPTGRQPSVDGADWVI